MNLMLKISKNMDQYRDFKTCCRIVTKVIKYLKCIWAGLSINRTCKMGIYIVTGLDISTKDEIKKQASHTYFKKCEVILDPMNWYIAWKIKKK